MGDGVSDADQVDLLDAGDQVSNLPGLQDRDGLRLGTTDSNLVGGHIERGSHESNGVSRADRTIDDPDVAHHPAVGVVERVEYEGPQPSAWITVRRRQPVHDRLEQLIDTLACLRRYSEHLV